MIKKIFLGLSALLVLGLVYLAIAGNEIQEIKTQIDIDAPPSKVWSILKEIDNWDQWSPIIKAAQGQAAVGSELTITMAGKKEGEAGPTYNPVITELEDAKHLRWKAHMLSGFVFTNYKVLELEPTSTGTRVTHKELFKGMLSPIVCNQMEKGVPPMLNAMNQALKELVEK